MLFSFKLCLCQDPRIARAYTAKNTKYRALVSLSPRTRSRPGAERIRQGEGRFRRPPRTCFIRSSPAGVKQNKQTLKPCSREEKHTLENVPPRNSKQQQLLFGNDAIFCKPSRCCRHQDKTKISGIPPRHAEFVQLLACLARHPSAFTSMSGTETAGQEALKPPPEAGARTKLFDREFQFRESHT